MVRRAVLIGSREEKSLDGGAGYGWRGGTLTISFELGYDSRGSWRWVCRMLKGRKFTESCPRSENDK